MVQVRAIFPNPRFVLLPGMFVRARIEEGVSENAILVPQVGVTHDPRGQATALVVDADDKAALHKLQLRGTSDTQWIVESGLNYGDRAAVDPDYRDLPWRLRGDRRKHRGASDRAADERARSPDLHLVQFGRLRHGDHDADFRGRNQSRHRPGAGAEQAAARHSLAP